MRLGTQAANTCLRAAHLMCTLPTANEKGHRRDVERLALERNMLKQRLIKILARDPRVSITGCAELCKRLNFSFWIL